MAEDKVQQVQFDNFKKDYMKEAKDGRENSRIGVYKLFTRNNQRKSR